MKNQKIEERPYLTIDLFEVQREEWEIYKKQEEEKKKEQKQNNVIIIDIY